MAEGVDAEMDVGALAIAATATWRCLADHVQALAKLGDTTNPAAIEQLRHAARAAVIGEMAEARTHFDAALPLIAASLIESGGDQRVEVGDSSTDNPHTRSEP